MRDGQVFNWRAGIIIVMFLAFIAYPFRNLFSSYENLQEKIKVNEQLTLYITQVESSSLSKNTFHFYLYDSKKRTQAFMSHINDIKPFLVVDDPKATATVINGEIHLRVRGNVYSFTAVGLDVRIHLDRSAY